MPISEDDYNQYSNDSIPSTTMSKAELRKTHKPIMEKRRRAKINNCLNEIKDLILVAMKKDPERHSKLEKADILEMAVKHLKGIQKQQREITLRSDPSVAMKYKSGFMECTTEVSSYVNGLEGLDPGLKQRLIVHLSKCGSSIEPKPKFPFGESYAPNSTLLTQFAQNRFQVDDQNNNPRIGGIELIPTNLPSGEFAFLVPKSSFSSILSTQMNDERPSAFVTVTPSSKLNHGEGLLQISKPLSPPMSPTSSEDIRNSSPRGFQPIIPKSEPNITSTTSHYHGNNFESRNLFQSNYETKTNFDIKPSVVIRHNFETRTGLQARKEIQNIKFPIHNPKKDGNISEPLCIITNNSERFRQAQMLEESCNNSENVYHGIKRRFREDCHNQGLLAFTQEPPRKILKVDRQIATSSQDSARLDAERQDDRKQDSNKKDTKQNEANCEAAKHDSMWRPW